MDEDQLVYDLSFLGYVYQNRVVPTVQYVDFCYLSGPSPATAELKKQTLKEKQRSSDKGRLRSKHDM